MNIASPDSDRLARASGIAACVWGTVLLVKGRELWLLVDGQPLPVDEVAIRILGLRHLVQGVVQTAMPSRFQRPIIGIDVSHAASMFWLAGVDERRRERVGRRRGHVGLGGRDDREQRRGEQREDGEAGHGGRIPAKSAARSAALWRAAARVAARAPLVPAPASRSDSLHGFGTIELRFRR